MTKKEIIFDWLSISGNRKKLPVMKINKSHEELLNAIADIYALGFDDKVYGVGENFFTVELGELKGISDYSMINQFLKEEVNKIN